MNIKEIQIKLVLVISLFFSFPNANATTTWTIGASGTYQSIADAWAALPNPIADDYILEIKSDYVTEAMPINLTQVNGTSATNTITIRPELGVTGLSISTTSSAAPAVFYFDGGDYITIDGRPGGVGASDFSITHSGVGLFGSLSPEEPSAITFINDATYNTIQYCTIQGELDATSPEINNHNIATGGVVQFRTGVTTGNSNNLIDNCKITKHIYMPDNLLYSSGTAGAENQANTVSNCEFTESRFYYVRIEDNNNEWTFLNNSFYQDDADGVANDGTTPHYLYMLYINDGGDHLVDGNYFGGQTASCGGSPFVRDQYSIKGVFFASGVNGAINTITNNTFSNWDLTMTLAGGSATDGDVLEGIYAGGSSDYEIDGNIFGSSIGIPSIDIETDIVSHRDAAERFRQLTALQQLSHKLAK